MTLWAERSSLVYLSTVSISYLKIFGLLLMRVVQAKVQANQGRLINTLHYDDIAL